jgi:hypothetical protein
MSDGEIGVGTFISYLREKKSLWLIVAVLALGVSMMLFGRTEVSHGAAGDTELRVKELCEQIDGVYDVHVMIVSQDENNVGGIAVVCDGGDNAAIKLKLTEVLSTLFKIPASSVSVVGGK